MVNFYEANELTEQSVWLGVDSLAPWLGGGSPQYNYS